MKKFQGKKAVCVLCIAVSDSIIKPLLRYNHPIVFFMHGVTQPSLVDVVVKVWKTQLSSKIDRLYLCGPSHHTVMQKLKIKHQKYMILPGLVQTDYLTKMKENLPTIRKQVFKGVKQCILILNQLKKNIPLAQILRDTRTVYPKARIYIKSKVKKGEDLCKSILRSRSMKGIRKHVSIIPWSDLVYPLFCANVIVLIGFSSCFVEALLVNPRTTMLIQEGNFYAKPPDGLLFTKRVRNIKKCLTYTKTDFIKSPKYHEAIRETMITYFGKEKPRMVSPLIVKDLLERFG
jgi:hypothetical protein